MGNHSNKKPKQLDPGATDGQTDLPPQKPAAEVFPEFNFHNGDLGSIHRIVARHQLKDRIKFLETVIKTHQLLVKAMKITQKAFQDGVQEGIRQVIAAEKARETNSGVPEGQPEATPGEPTPVQTGLAHSDLPSASPELKAVLNP